MRDILFKAKRIYDGKWVEGSVYRISEKHNPFIMLKDSFGESYEVDEDTICQYTGLADKNGNRIWENDVVKCNYNDYGEKGTYIGKVIFREDTCTFVVTDGKNTDYEWWNEEKEVIGNIFDNPELIGE